MTTVERCDVIVIGGGSPAFEGPVAATQRGADKRVKLEKVTGGEC